MSPPYRQVGPSSPASIRAAKASKAAYEGRKKATAHIIHYPNAVRAAIVAFSKAQSNATSVISDFWHMGDHFTGPSMLLAYTTANHLVDLQRAASLLIAELRRYGPNGYVPEGESPPKPKRPSKTQDKQVIERRIITKEDFPKDPPDGTRLKDLKSGKVYQYHKLSNMWLKGRL